MKNNNKRRESVAGVVTLVAREGSARRLGEDKGAICKVLGHWREKRNNEKS